MTANRQTEVRYTVFSGVDDPSEITLSDVMVRGVSSRRRAVREWAAQGPKENCRIYKSVIEVSTWDVTEDA